MKIQKFFKFCLLLVFAAGNTSLAQNNNDKSNIQGSFSVGALYSSFNNPTFRYPSGGEELYLPQSSFSPGFFAGYQYNISQLGFGARVIYWHTSFKDFFSEEMPGSQTFVNYIDPAFTHISFDLYIEWILTKKFHFGIYGLLGMASSTEKYDISGSSFPEWNGQKSLTEFDYSYGFGIKISPVKWVSVIAEIRWIPGDATHPLKFLYSQGIWNYYQVLPGYSTNKTAIISTGLSFNFGLPRRKGI